MGWMGGSSRDRALGRSRRGDSGFCFSHGSFSGRRSASTEASSISQWLLTLRPRMRPSLTQRITVSGWMQRSLAASAERRCLLL